MKRARAHITTRRESIAWFNDFSSTETFNLMDSEVDFSLSPKPKKQRTSDDDFQLASFNMNTDNLFSIKENVEPKPFTNLSTAAASKRTPHKIKTKKRRVFHRGKKSSLSDIKPLQQPPAQQQDQRSKLRAPTPSTMPWGFSPRQTQLFTQRHGYGIPLLKNPCK